MCVKFWTEQRDLHNPPSCVVAVFFIEFFKFSQCVTTFQRGRIWRAESESITQIKLSVFPYQSSHSDQTFSVPMSELLSH